MKQKNSRTLRDLQAPVRTLISLSWQRESRSGITLAMHYKQ